MFGSEIVAAVYDREVRALDAVIDTVGERMAHAYVPLDMPLPAHTFHADDGSYAPGSIGHRPHGDLSFEVVRWVARFFCEGESTDPILGAAEAAVAHFTDTTFDTAWRGWHYTLHFRPMHEAPAPPDVQNNRPYRRLGTIYEVDVTRGGEIP